MQRIRAGEREVTVDYTVRRCGDGRAYRGRMADVDGRRVAVSVTDRTEVERREEALRAAMEAAEAASAARARFLATMSHEIRTPLNSVVGLADLLAEMPLPAEPDTSVALLRRSARHLLDLLDGVLEYRALETSSAVLHPEAVSPAEIVAEVVGPLQLLYADRGLRVAWEAAPEVPATVSLDRTRFLQVVQNLVGNAVKFTSEGGVEVHLGWRDADAAGHGVLVLTVTDTGPGIAPEELTRLRRPFEQGEGGRRRSHGGVGLGLALVDALTTALGGGLDIVSEPGSGTRAVATLRARVVSSPDDDASLSVELLLGVVVLIVDDDSTNRFVLGRMLDRVGIETRFATGGREALDQLEANDGISLIVMDVHMPDMDGLELLRTLRGRGWSRPVIVVTADIDTQLDKTLIAAGAQRVLRKPVGAAELRAAVRGVLPTGAGPTE